MAGDPTSRNVAYIITCPTCRNSFDAMQALWCSCLTTARTFVCPACLNCFCQAPREYRDRFWSQAPPELWRRKMEERGLPFQPEAPPDPKTMIRPLVLVADDEREIQRIASGAVMSLGYSLLVARDGQEALDLARRYLPDLILTDALMPKVDGREVCRRLKSDPATGAIKAVVMTSAFTAGQYKTEAMKQFRVDDYVAKPLDFKTLRALLQKHLG